jgi:hypothetical protein
MSYAGNVSDVEQDSSGVSKNMTDSFRRNRSSQSLISKPGAKMSEVIWNDKRDKSDDSDSEISDSGNFLAKGAFLLTPSHELSMDKAALICEKMNFKGCFSLTKTATGILFKFSHPEDYQMVFKKGFHKVTNARFYKKVAIPCRPQKTFTLFVFDVPEEVPIEDIRHSLYRFNSVVEVVRLLVYYTIASAEKPASAEGGAVPKPQLPSKLVKPSSVASEDDMVMPKETPPPPIRITLAALDEYTNLLQNGLDFYGATYFPTEKELPATAAKIATSRRGRMVDGSIPGRVRELLPVFDAAGFCKIPPPASKTIKPRP